MSGAFIRPAILEDLAKIEMIERRCFAPRRRSSKRAMRHSLQSSAQRVLIADLYTENGFTSVGMMTLFIYPKTIRIYSLAVLSSYRKEGVGRALLQHALWLATEMEKSRVTLEADRKKARLVRWYERAGFRVIEMLPGYYGAGSCAVRMEFKLHETEEYSRGDE